MIPTDYVKAFVFGGLICVVGQILMDKTKFSPARILVSFVVIGAVLGGLGLYKPFVDFAGAGASVPLPGFGYLLVKGVTEAVDQHGAMGIISGGIKAAAVGLTAACIGAFLVSLLFNPKEKG